jgi:hypothetical protein
MELWASVLVATIATVATMDGSLALRVRGWSNVLNFVLGIAGGIVAKESLILFNSDDLATFQAIKGI